MVKLKGPGMATAASGSIAGTLTLSTWKGRAYLKNFAKPKQPRTADQIAMRAIVTFISKIWTHLSAADQALWQPLASATSISPFNACQSRDLTRWRGFHYPATILPDDEDGNPQNWATWTTTVVPRGIHHLLASSTVNDGIGWPLHRSTTPGFSRAWNNLVKVVKCLPFNSPFTWLDRLEPGTYYYKGMRLANDGNAQTQLSRGPLVVT